VGDYLQRFEQQPKHRKSICRARSGFGRLERTGLLVHSLGFALVLFSSLFLVSMVILEIPLRGQWKLRRFVRMPACLVADLCPALLVLTGVVFLYAYQPFVRAFKAQLSQSASFRFEHNLGHVPESEFPSLENPARPRLAVRALLSIGFRNGSTGSFRILHTRTGSLSDAPRVVKKLKRLEIA
jgi:hypothetical protein